jgi:hypothetical protein
LVAAESTDFIDMDQKTQFFQLPGKETEIQETTIINTKTEKVN